MTAGDLPLMVALHQLRGALRLVSASGRLCVLSLRYSPGGFLGMDEVLAR